MTATFFYKLVGVEIDRGYSDDPDSGDIECVSFVTEGWSRSLHELAAAQWPPLKKTDVVLRRGRPPIYERRGGWLLLRLHYQAHPRDFPQIDVFDPDMYPQWAKAWRALEKARAAQAKQLYEQHLEETKARRAEEREAIDTQQAIATLELGQRARDLDVSRLIDAVVDAAPDRLRAILDALDTEETP